MYPAIEVPYEAIFQDASDGYYDDSYVGSYSILNGNQLEFQDSPSKLPGMFKNDEVMVFYTELVGVDQAGNVVARLGQCCPNASFTWSTNQAAGILSDGRYSGGIFFSTLPDQEGLPPYVGGDIAIVTESGRAPVADAGPDQIVEQDSHAGASVTLDGSGSSDPDSDQLTYTWTWDSSLATGINPTVILPSGTTTVILTVSDGRASDTDTVDITVQDTAPPTINSISSSPNVLWPPNRKLVEVFIEVDATDLCDPSPSCWILGVSSNEPVNGPGDGNTELDWEYTDDPLVVLLRAERAGGDDGRVYTVNVVCEDASGNMATETVDVIVPHDQGKAKK